MSIIARGSKNLLTKKIRKLNNLLKKWLIVINYMVYAVFPEIFKIKI